MIETGSDIDIYDIDGNKIAIAGYASDAIYKRELMSEHYILITLNWIEKADFLRGCYIDYQGKRYTLRDDAVPTIDVNTGGYHYELKFESFEMFFLDFILFYTYQDLKEAEWTLTAKAENFLLIALDSINEYFGLTDEAEKWKIGICTPTETLNISFSSQNVFDGLTDIAEQFGAEWWLDYDNKTLNLGYYEFGDEIELQRERELTDITVSNANNEEYCTRLFAFGSTRNIPSNYRGVNNGSTVDAIVQKKLRLPASNGDYIDAFPNMKKGEIIERVKVFDSIYPRRIGEITALRVDDTQKDEDGNPWLIYYFKDSGLNFSKDYILPGQTLMLSFGENSWLSGRDFELAYHEDTQEFEIINDQSIEGLTIPNDILKPRIGDNYVLYNFDISLVGDQYVGEAEQELLVESQSWLQSIIEDNATYECPINMVEYSESDLDFEIGQKVKLVSVLFKNGFKSSRIFGHVKNIDGSAITYTVGDKPRYSRLKTLEKEVSANKKISDLQYVEAMKTAKSAYRNAKALNYLRTALENNTEIDGGLILTTLIRLGFMVGDVWQENAGINGINEGGDDVAFWAGGTLEQAVNLVANPDATSDVAQIVITQGGGIIANEAYIKGKIKATSGQIGNFNIINSFLYYYSGVMSESDVEIRLGNGVFGSVTSKGNFWLKDRTTNMYKKELAVFDTGMKGEYSGTPYLLRNIALNIDNGSFRIAPGNIVDIPGLLMSGTIKGGAVSYRWGRARNFYTYPFTLSITDNEYKINHNLGHSNYTVLVTPILPTGASWMKYHPIIIGLNNQYAGIVFIDSGTNNSRVTSDFCFSIFGDNTADY